MDIFHTNIWKMRVLDNNVMYITWLEDAANMEDEDFKLHLILFTDSLKEHNCDKFMVDTRYGHVVMGLDIQEWHDSQIVPIYLALGIKKIAFILPEDAFVSMSLTQTFEEEKGQLLNTRYFDDEKNALEWIAE
ncbi:MAG: hypothetical protein EAZ85_09155 [Bacteroidetes bacterium]|nr:MAG: hypothetical protein EAZ85_09155 [Bacteroidota bacterium]TAG91269.1 MAG: hypothetical protein EAZ20_03415 [Bacteroidota bacterium]